MEPLIAGFVSVTAFGGIHLSTALGGPLLADFVFVTALRGIHFVVTPVVTLDCLGAL